MEILIRRKGELVTSSWSGGSTTELFVFPTGTAYASRDFDIRISSATIDDEQSVFTALPGFYRTLMPLDKPLKLVFQKNNKEQTSEILLSPFDTVEFEGAWHTISKGSCTDIGIMTSKAYRADFLKLAFTPAPCHEPQLLTGQLLCHAGFVAIYALDDNTKVCTPSQRITLMQGDFLLAKIVQAETLTITQKNQNSSAIAKIVSAS